jgi:hypothetical protein
MLPLISHTVTAPSKKILVLFFMLFVAINSCVVFVALLAINQIYFDIVGTDLFTITWQFLISVVFLAHLFKLFTITLLETD